MERRLKIVRTDRELEMNSVDARLRDLGATLVKLPDGVAESELERELIDADLLLMCYTKVSRAVIEKAQRLKAIIKYGVGIDAIDIVAARERGIPVVNIPYYAEETVAEGAFSLMLGLAGVAVFSQRSRRKDAGPRRCRTNRQQYGSNGKRVSNASAGIRSTFTWISCGKI
jgi:phosphoglycerate dehydrogenase-like enzyme